MSAPETSLIDDSMSQGPSDSTMPEGSSDSALPERTFDSTIKNDCHFRNTTIDGDLIEEPEFLQINRPVCKLSFTNDDSPPRYIDFSCFGELLRIAQQVKSQQADGSIKIFDDHDMTFDEVKTRFQESVEEIEDLKEVEFGEITENSGFETILTLTKPMTTHDDCNDIDYEAVKAYFYPDEA